MSNIQKSDRQGKHIIEAFVNEIIRLKGGENKNEITKKESRRW